MIRILKDYFDKHGNRYKVLSFNGDRYACQSYNNNGCVYLTANELFSSPPIKPVKAKFTDMVKQKKEEVVEIPADNNEVSEPLYESEPVYDFSEKNEQPVIALKDNDKETAEDDFYADF